MRTPTVVTTPFFYMLGFSTTETATSENLLLIRLFTLLTLQQAQQRAALWAARLLSGVRICCDFCGSIEGRVPGYFYKFLIL